MGRFDAYARVVRSIVIIYASNAPSRFVGFMEPVRTQFQSAMADLKGKTMAATTAMGLIHSRHKYRPAFCRRLECVCGLDRRVGKGEGTDLAGNGGFAKLRTATLTHA